MNSRHVGFFTALALVAGARAASADTPDSPWGIAVYGGDSVAESGSLRSPHAPLAETLPDLGTLDPALGGSSGALSLNKLRYEDLFKRSFDTGLELNYSFSDAMQSYARFSYSAYDGRTRDAGVLSSSALGISEPLRARFDDQDNKSLEIGSRYFWQTGTDWKPFAGVSLGATRLDAITASFTVPDTAIDLQNVRFTRAATVFSQSVEAGVEYNPTRAFGVRFSVDANHVGDQPSGDDLRLAQIGFDPNHDATSRWSFPVAVAAAYHFD
jgi:opacity protein-like surface antigen